jgi:WD40 repeat protein
MLKIMMLCIIGLQLLSNNTQAMEQKKNHQFYKTSQIREEKSYNKFEKIAWSHNEKHFASYRYIKNKCEVFIWDIRAHTITSQPHITIYNEKIVNLFWSPDNKNLIVVCEHAAYKYRIFDKNNSSGSCLKYTLLENSKLKIHTASLNHYT